ncbi:carbamoyltransferase C-terminal domain-containing protein [Salinarimonas chemoclinalis]|uniref:carbamoyltransferase C-terminal domain-containing protein n=1 Tax=Salinarimonas chemoclinalis TaxID=3241599 RepID=UPI0035566DB4
MALILSISSTSHDAAVSLHDDYRTLAAVPLERVTRVKSDGRRLPHEAVAEALTIGGVGARDVDVLCLARGHMPARLMRFGHDLHGLRRRAQILLDRLAGRERGAVLKSELHTARTLDAARLLDAAALMAELGLRPDTRLHVYNHHLAHALPCLFHNPDWEDALLYTSDGGGDGVCYSIRSFRDGALETLYGGDEWVLKAPRVDSVALAYGYATEALGYKIQRHEGKLTGLAAWGEPVLRDRLRGHFRVDPETGEILSDFPSTRAMRRAIFAMAEGVSREDVSASVQDLAEETTLAAVRRLLERRRSRNLGVAGGLFANVKLNQRLVEEAGIDRLFVYPAMSDQGLPPGGALSYLLERDGLPRWLASRARLESVYLGRDFDAVVDAHLAAEPGLARVSDDPIGASVDALERREAVALYAGRMEFGPRALGARSVLAAPDDPSVNQTLNARMERSEFMPFAPFCAEEDADTIFDLPAGARYAAEFMTVTCRVRADWRERLAGVTHVDGTARPQVIRRALNPTYWDILAAWKARTGLPALINTSFNVHEEPIIDTPAQCARALLDDRVDAVATRRALYRRRT